MPDFVNRVSNIPIVESGLKSASEKYESIKSFVPTPLNYAVGMAENAVSLALTTAESVATRFPAPVKYADDMACSALDKVESESKKFTDFITNLPEHILNVDNLSNLAISDEHKTYYMEMFHYIQTCHLILSDKVAFEIEFIQRRMNEATQEIHKKLQDFLNDLKKESPQGDVARLPRPLVKVIKKSINIMNDILARLSTLKEKSQGEVERVYTGVHKILADVKEKTTEIAHDGTIKVNELRQYMERIKFVKDILAILQKYTPLGRLIPTITADEGKEMKEVAGGESDEQGSSGEVEKTEAKTEKRENGTIDEVEGDYEQVGNASSENSDEQNATLEDSRFSGEASLLDNTAFSEYSEDEERQF